MSCQLPARRLAALFLLLVGCGGGAGEGTAGTAPSNGDPPAAPPPAAAPAPSSGRTLAVRSDKTTYAIPDALADWSALSQLADGRTVLSLTARQDNLDWTAGDRAAVQKAAAELATIAAGTTIVWPASRHTRDQLEVSVAADAPATCQLAENHDLPECSLDRTTMTQHVSPGYLPQHDGQDTLFVGPNVTGGLLVLTKVTVTGDVIELYGTSGTLGDVFDKVDVSSVGQERADTDGFMPLTDPFTFDFSGRTLYAEGPVTLTLKTGRIDLQPKVKTSLKMSGFTVEEAALAVKGDLHLAVELDLGVDAAISASFTKDVEATLFEAQSPLPPVAVGPVPIAETVKFRLIAKCRIEASASAHVTAGATLAEAITVGGHYTPAAGFQSDVEATPPALVAKGPTFTGDAKTSASCSVEGRFSLLVYGVIGPYVGLSANANFDAAVGVGSPLTWELDGTVAGHAGVESQVSVPGLGPLSKWLTGSLAKTDTTLFSKTTVLAKSQ